jgi:hypothetical protein
MSVWELDSPVKSSRWQQGCVIFFYVMALVAVWVAYIPLWLALMLSVLLGVLFVGQHRASKKRVITRLSTEQEQWFIYLVTGQRLKVALEDVFLWRYLVVLRCKSHALAVPYQLILFPDSLDAGDYRKLQARLRLMDT